MDSIRDKILLDVDLIHTTGIPGKIIVFGKDAEAILTSKNEEDVIMAVALVGKGRLCVFSHEEYGKDLCYLPENDHNATFYRNVKNWVAGKELTENYHLLNLDEDDPIQSLQELQEFEFLVSFGGKESTSAKLIEEYIREGGGFIYATTPWGWLQLNPGKHAYDMPYIQLLLDAGVAYAKGTCEDDEPEFAVNLNKATDANLERCITGCNLTKMIDKVNIIALSRDLPPYLKEKVAKEVLKEWEQLNDKVIKTFPSGKIQTEYACQKKLLDFWTLCAEMHEKINFRAWGIIEFPGDYEILPEIANETFKFSSTMEDYYFTSCFVTAGIPVKLSVKNIKNTWTVIVGAQSDILEDIVVRRWPKVSFKTEINEPGIYDISTPFGGNVYFLSPNEISTIEATISNVVICPRFELNCQKKPWRESRNDPGLWADISGKYLTITAPSSSIRNLDDPTEIIGLFDELLVHYHDLRGTDINNERKMWVVADEQPSAGYMHAGYPIVTHLDIFTPTNQDDFLLSAKNFKAGLFWGIFHEMGHNMQQPEWTFSGTDEVTVNIFTLYGMFVMCGINTWIHPWLAEQIVDAVTYLKSGALFEQWQAQAGMALCMYAQLVHDFKWETYKRVFRRYQAMTPGDKPESEEDKIDLWFLIFSEESKFNLSPLAIFWGLPLSDNGMKKLEALNFKAFLPNDEITKDVPDRVHIIKGRFPNLIQTIDTN